MTPRLTPENNFRGAVSCVQFYPATMSESAIFSRKHCEKAAAVHRSPKCPEDFPHFWKGDCFKVSLSMGHGLDRSDPLTRLDRSEILTRP